ncbi:MAG: hypothetical protein IPH45_12500 [Bacteroidales bacterium]|nr:hypothetical protein [Bacteroidales bacterium]
MNYVNRVLLRSLLLFYCGISGGKTIRNTIPPSIGAVPRDSDYLAGHDLIREDGEVPVLAVEHRGN